MEGSELRICDSGFSGLGMFDGKNHSLQLCDVSDSLTSQDEGETVARQDSETQRKIDEIDEKTREREGAPAAHLEFDRLVRTIWRLPAGWLSLGQGADASLDHEEHDRGGLRGG